MFLTWRRSTFHTPVSNFDAGECGLSSGKQEAMSSLTGRCVGDERFSVALFAGKKSNKMAAQSHVSFLRDLYTQALPKCSACYSQHWTPALSPSEHISTTAAPRPCRQLLRGGLTSKTIRRRYEVREDEGDGTLKVG